MRSRWTWKCGVCTRSGSATAGRGPPCGQSRPSRIVNSPMSRCPSPTMYSASRRMASRSSMQTRDVPGTSLGWSTTTTGRCRCCTTARYGSSSDAEYTTKPSTPAASTAADPSDTLRFGPIATNSRPWPASSHDSAKSGNEIQRRRIAERIVERFGDHQPDGAGLAGTQRAGHRVGSRVPQPLGGGQHAFAKVRRQLVGPVVGVGDGGARNLQFGRQRGQGRPAPWHGTPGHAL